MDIRTAYLKVKNEIHLLKDEGVSFVWKDVDLSSILISDFIINEMKPIKAEMHNLYKLLKLKFYAFRKHQKYKKKKIGKKKTNAVLIFFNVLNQWENIEPVWRELREKKVGVHIISTKLHLLKILPEEVESKELIFGIDLFAKTIKFKNKNNNILNLVNHSLPKLKYLYQKFNSVLSSQDYKYVIVGNDNTTEGRLIASIALKYKIRIGSIQHGSMNRINPLHGLSLADDFFVYGVNPAQELAFLGKNKDSVLISGWTLQQNFKKNLQSLRHKNNHLLKSDILVCLSGEGHSVSIEQHKKVIQLITELQTELNLKIIIKLHPKDDQKYFEDFNKEHTIILDNNSLSKNESSLLELFIQTKCTLTVASTAALESLLTETPVITIDLNNSYKEIDFIKDGLTYHATNYDELKEHYLNISNTPKGEFSAEFKAKVEKYYFNFFTEEYDPTQFIAKTILTKCAE